MHVNELRSRAPNEFSESTDPVTLHVSAPCDTAVTSENFAVPGLFSSVSTRS
jgi:hypothetical protein